MPAQIGTSAASSASARPAGASARARPACAHAVLSAAGGTTGGSRHTTPARASANAGSARPMKGTAENFVPTARPAASPTGPRRAAARSPPTVAGRRAPAGRGGGSRGHNRGWRALRVREPPGPRRAAIPLKSARPAMRTSAAPTTRWRAAAARGTAAPLPGPACR